MVQPWYLGTVGLSVLQVPWVSLFSRYRGSVCSLGIVGLSALQVLWVCLPVLQVPWVCLSVLQVCVEPLLHARHWTRWVTAVAKAGGSGLVEISTGETEQTSPLTSESSAGNTGAVMWQKTQRQCGHEGPSEDGHSS